MNFQMNPNGKRYLMAPISPAMISSTVSGVAIIASKVFWQCIRTNEA